MNFSLAQVFSGVALSQLALLLFLIVLSNKENVRVQTILFLFITAVIAYVTGPFLSSEVAIKAHLAWQTLVPGMLWLLCGCLFEDSFDLSPQKIALVAFTVLPPTIARAIGGDFSGQNFGGFSFWLFFGFPQALEFILMIWALFYVVRTWRDDLVQARRDLRLWFCLLAGGYSFILILIREILFPNENWWQSLQFILVAFVCFGVNLFLLRFRVSQLAVSETQKVRLLSHDTQSIEGHGQINAKLVKLMDDEKLYRQMGLTIAEVAMKVGCPEHQLRKVINQGLGYRNFNGYLNQFRVAEACAKLTDGNQSSEPILNIALDVGFRSLSSFNAAFKAKTGKTPTEYREDSLTNSEKH